MSSLGLLYDAAEENARGYGRKIGLKIVKPDEDSASTENTAKKSAAAPESDAAALYLRKRVTRGSQCPA
jgi:hypothetical protein